VFVDSTSRGAPDDVVGLVRPLRIDEAVNAIMARAAQITYFQPGHEPVAPVSQEPSPAAIEELSPSVASALTSTFTWSASPANNKGSHADTADIVAPAAGTPPSPGTPAPPTTPQAAVSGTPLSATHTPEARQQNSGSDYTPSAGMMSPSDWLAHSRGGSRVAGGSRSSMQPKSGAHSRRLPGSQPRSSRRQGGAAWSGQRIQGLVSSHPSSTHGAGVGAMSPGSAASPRVETRHSFYNPLGSSPAAGGSEYYSGPRRQARGNRSHNDSGVGGTRAKGGQQEQDGGGDAMGMRGGLAFAPGFFPVHGMGGHQESAMTRSAQFAYASMDRSLRSNMSVRDRGVDFRPRWRI